VLNRTHTGMSGRLEVPIGVAYDSDPREVERVLLGIAESNPLVLEDPAPRVLLMGFGDSSINFELRCWLRDVNFLLSAKSDMNFDIVERFRLAGITIPFPQRDVNITGLDHLTAGPGTKSAAPEHS
jgi:potassium efflux system protein